MSEPSASGIDRRTLAAAHAAERERFTRANPESRALFERARDSLIGGVPMSWMTKWAGPHPLFFTEARGARLSDADGHTYVDLCLGDTGAMAGHAPAATADALDARYRSGATTMLPGSDAVAAAEELARRFGLPLWQLTLSATDANRFAIRTARELTGRDKILVFSWCYHGTVDETFITLGPDGPQSRAGNVGAPVDPTVTTRVVEFNDIDAVRAELAQGDVACVLTEPALTNIGIVLPGAGFLEDLRTACTESGSLLIHDETHTFSAGPGGYTGAHGLSPDIITIGKAIAGGMPAGAFGMTAELAERAAALEGADFEDTGGVGGTLSGNALSAAAILATLGSVLTDEAFAGMCALAERFTAGVRGEIERRGLPWHITTLGARAEYRFSAEPPKNGGASAALGDPELEDFMHLFALNRGVLITPFHNMALMCPATTADDVDRHTEVFAEALDALG